MKKLLKIEEGSREKEQTAQTVKNTSLWEKELAFFLSFYWLY